MPQTQFAYVGGGCFWCTEAIFQCVRGVVAVTPGYAGGRQPNPNYEQVCAGVTGHAEVIRIEFDSAQITYEQILDIFFEVHDPTTLNQQGADVGTQYRSIILTTSKEQENTAKAKISSLVTAKKFGTRRITTEIIPLDQFFIAEGYHHNYFKRFQDAPYCQVIIDPKVQQFITKHPTLTKS